MKAQEKEDKVRIKFRYAVGLYNALKTSPMESYRSIAKEAGMEPAHMQKISVGKLDVTLTTNVAIANALNISYSDYCSYYDNVTEKQTEEFVEYLKKQKSLKGKTKTKISDQNRTKDKKGSKKSRAKKKK